MKEIKIDFGMFALLGFILWAMWLSAWTEYECYKLWWEKVVIEEWWLFAETKCEF